MEKIIITTDSAADLSAQMMQERGIVVTPFNVILGTQEYLDGVSITPQMIFDYVAEICYALDAPTPVVIKAHIFNYAKYNYVKFIKNDFVEVIDFDKLILENIATK